MPLSVKGMVAAVDAAAQAAMQAAIKSAQDDAASAKASAAATDARSSDVATKAAAAQATADNARQMVLNRDPLRVAQDESIASIKANTTMLQELTSQYGASTQESTLDRASLRAMIVALTATVAGIKSATPTALGMAATPALALNATVDIVVPLTETMPTADYIARVASPITGLTLTVKSKTTTSVTITLKAGLALGVSTLLVHAHY